MKYICFDFRTILLTIIFSGNYATRYCKGGAQTRALLDLYVKQVIILAKSYIKSEREYRFSKPPHIKFH